MANRLDVSDQTAISMPMKTLISIVSACGRLGILRCVRTYHNVETKAQLAEKDLNQISRNC